MKHNVPVLAFATVLFLASCSKNLQQSAQPVPGITQSTIQASTTLAATREDRIDSIMKGLSADNYSLSFDKTYASAGITRTAYGADNYLVFADPQDVICGEPLRYQIKKVPIYKRPNFVVPTCPDMSIDIWKLSQIQELLVKADPAQFKGAKQIKLADGKTLLATERFTSQYANLKSDRIDAITKDLSPDKFILLGNSDALNGGVFTRNFYGWADLNSIVFKQYKLSLKDILKPTQKGCFDPLILKVIRERLVELNASLYKNLTVTPLAQDKNIAVLSY
ncbi:MAG: hypothetical protein INR73_08530 [Williamsia sp.]|nr:hypothetical protein [Williamsia sp.]